MFRAFAEPDRMIAGLIFSLAAIALFAWAMLRLAIFALPVWLGFSTFLWAARGEIGFLLGVPLGLVAGVAAVLGGRMILASRLPVLLRVGVAALFAVPASMAGFSVVSALMRLGDGGELATSIAAWLGALAIGMAALASLAVPDNPAISDRRPGAQAG